MTNEEILREFNALPTKARREAEDFIAFLRARYAKDKRKRTDRDLLAEDFVGMWKDREEFNDSSAWVREMRQNEWSN